MTTPALWNDPVAKWNDLWFTWNGAPIPLPRAKNFACQVHGDTIPVLKPLADYTSIFAPVYGTEPDPSLPPALWNDPLVTWNALHYAWNGSALAIPHPTTLANILLRPPAIFVMVKPATTAP